VPLVFVITGAAFSPCHLDRTLSILSQTRALAQAALSVELKSRVAILTLGGVIGLAVGGAYLGGEAVQASTIRAKAERLQEAGANGYSQEALADAAGGLDASALAIANRHAPNGVSGSALRDRQTELLMARLDETTKPSSTTPARPFQMAGALDQSRDLDCLTRAAYYEARGEGADGMRAVTQVVLNRVRHSAFPSSVCGVVYQGSNRSTGCQFSFTCNGAMRGAVNRAAWNRARDIASEALSGKVYAAVGTATHFHTTSVSPGWRNRLVRVTQVGDHYFYRFGGRSGTQNAFNAKPEPSVQNDTRLIAAVLPAQPAQGPVAYRSLVENEAAADTAVKPAQVTTVSTHSGTAPVDTKGHAPT